MLQRSRQGRRGESANPGTPYTDRRCLGPCLRTKFILLGGAEGTCMNCPPLLVTSRAVALQLYGQFPFLGAYPGAAGHGGRSRVAGGSHVAAGRPSGNRPVVSSSAMFAGAGPGGPWHQPAPPIRGAAGCPLDPRGRCGFLRRMTCRRHAPRTERYCLVSLPSPDVIMIATGTDDGAGARSQRLSSKVFARTTVRVRTSWGD